jgi:selenocysteine lyase/cysteine desulfurase
VLPFDEDVGALGCDFYAASGQKWLYVRAERIPELAPLAPGQ